MPKHPGPAGPQERPSGGLASSDQDYTDVYGHPVTLSLSVHLTFASRVSGRSDRECQDLRLGLTWCPKTCQDLRLGLTWCPETCQNLRLELTLCHRDLPGLRIRLTTFAARIDYVSPRPAKGIDGITGVHLSGCSVHKTSTTGPSRFPRLIVTNVLVGKKSENGTFSMFIEVLTVGCVDMVQRATGYCQRHRFSNRCGALAMGNGQWALECVGVGFISVRRKEEANSAEQIAVKVELFRANPQNIDPTQTMATTPNSGESSNIDMSKLISEMSKLSSPPFSSHPLPISFNISSLFPVPMDRTNYLSWKSQFEDVLEMHGLAAVVKNNTDPPKVQEDGSVHPELAKDKLVLSWIKATSSSSIKTLLIPCTTAHQAWTMLAKRLSPLASTRVRILRDQIRTLRKDNNTTVTDYLNYAKSLFDSSHKLVQQWMTMNSSVMFWMVLVLNTKS
ncbi:hypothetical protein Prudu_013124 [Prunus dulcis]|uniref:Retrotransposon Copia-like N-terminal domain-containing protein n=1 Tax=Prunus dulcis TaxID=3755 RepID=A0A4Y1RET2_PRUDU|nr:hypothetical protein Prudu_013124 [Prunus dulcis]